MRKSAKVYKELGHYCNFRETLHRCKHLKTSIRHTLFPWQLADNTFHLSYQPSPCRGDLTSLSACCCCCCCCCLDFLSSSSSWASDSVTQNTHTMVHYLITDCEMGGATILFNDFRYALQHNSRYSLTSKHQVIMYYRGRSFFFLSPMTCSIPSFLNLTECVYKHLAEWN